MQEQDKTRRVLELRRTNAESIAMWAYDIGVICEEHDEYGQKCEHIFLYWEELEAICKKARELKG